MSAAKQISKDYAVKQRAIAEALAPRNRNLFAVSIEFLFSVRQYKTSEAQKRANKKWREKRKNDLEFRQKNREKSVEWYSLHKDDPEFKALNLARTTTWLKKNKDDQIVKAKLEAATKKWQLKNPKKLEAATKKWQLKNPKKLLANALKHYLKVKDDPFYKELKRLRYEIDPIFRAILKLQKAERAKKLQQTKSLGSVKSILESHTSEQLKVELADLDSSLKSVDVRSKKGGFLDGGSNRS